VEPGWRKLHNEELRNLYYPPNIIKEIKSKWIRLIGHVARKGDLKNACKILVGKREGIRPVARTRHRRWIILEWILQV
jgi:hypothetical protein